MTKMKELETHRPVKVARSHFQPQSIGIGMLFLLLAWLIVVPLAMIFWGSFRSGPPGVSAFYTIDNYIRAFKNANLLRSCYNTLIFGIGSTIISFAGGTFLAWVTERTDVPFRKAIYAIVLIPIVVPAVLFATSWLFLLNPTIGIVNKFAPFGLALRNRS